LSVEIDTGGRTNCTLQHKNHSEPAMYFGTLRLEARDFPIGAQTASVDLTCGKRKAVVPVSFERNAIEPRVFVGRGTSTGEDLDCGGVCTEGLTQPKDLSVPLEVRAAVGPPITIDKTPAVVALPERDGDSPAVKMTLDLHDRARH